MKDIPIIFSAPMVRALLDGRKTMTRRLAMQERKTAPTNDSYDTYFVESPWRRVKPGDRLWVRENFSGPWAYREFKPSEWGEGCPIWYWVAGNPTEGDWTKPKPSIHMPRYASRLTLTVTAVKIEPLHYINEQDAWAEGAERLAHDGEGKFYQSGAGTYRCGFAGLWAHLHGAESWDANPEVVALTFTVAKGNIDEGSARLSQSKGAGGARETRGLTQSDRHASSDTNNSTVILSTQERGR